jgi:hypothetical protein
MSEAQEQEGEHGVGDFVGFLTFSRFVKRVSTPVRAVAFLPISDL